MDEFCLKLFRLSIEIVKFLKDGRILFGNHTIFLQKVEP